MTQETLDEVGNRSQAIASIFSKLSDLNSLRQVLAYHSRM